jgi:hypothetical protein
MKQNLSDKSTPELLKLKASWLKEHELMLRELTLAVWEIGKHAEEYNREISIFNSGEVSFVAHKAAEIVDTKNNKPIVKYWLAAMKGNGKWFQGIQLAYYTFYEQADMYGNSDKQFQNFIVPGDWMNLAASVIEAAKIKQETDYAKEEEKERQWLLTKLLDGKDI